MPRSTFTAPSTQERPHFLIPEPPPRPPLQPPADILLEPAVHLTPELEGLGALLGCGIFRDEAH